MKRAFITIVFFFSCFAISSLKEIHAQPLPKNSGLLQPFIRYFKPSDYRAHSQNWDVAQGPEGLIYVANTKGLLRYDGYRWDKIAMPNHNIVRQVELYNDTLFVGAKGTWGYVKNDSTGALKFISLKERTKQAGANIKTIWKMIGTKKGLYIRNGAHLMRWNKGKLHLFPDSLKTVSIFRRSGQNIFAFLKSGALVIIDGKTVKPFYDGKGLEKKFVKSAYYINNDSLALFTSKTPLILKDNKVTPWLTEAQGLLKNNYVIHTLQLANGNIALATTAGLIIITPSGKLVRHLDKTNGLPFNIVINLFLDKEGDLWLPMNNGLAVLNSNFAVNYFSGDRFGGKVMAIAFYRNHFYIATTHATYKLTSTHNKEQFVEIPKTHVPGRALLATREGLLLGSATAIKVINKKGVRAISNYDHVVDFTRSKYNPDTIYASSIEGLVPIRLVNGKWKAGNLIYKGGIRSIFEIGKKDFIAETATGGVLRIKVKGDSTIVKRYGLKEGLPSGRLIVSRMGHLFLASSGDSTAWFRIKKRGIKIIANPIPSLNITQVAWQDSTTAWSWNGKLFIKLMKKRAAGSGSTSTAALSILFA